MKEMGFFSEMQLFSKWNPNLLKKLYLNTFKVPISKGEFVFKEGDDISAVYIICSGEFTVHTSDGSAVAAPDFLPSSLSLIGD